MTALNLLAVQNAPLLRALVSDPTTSKAELATAIGKDRSNLNRSITALAEAGLLNGSDDGERGLTDLGREQLAAIERAEGVEGKPGSSEGLPADHVIVVHSQLMPDPDNARKDWESEEAIADLAELAESIDQRGLLQNPMVKLAPADLQIPGQPTTYMLDGGERRWRAIGRLIADGRWPAERRIICRLIDADELGHRLAALAENMQRRNLNPLEKARAFDGLAEALAAQGVAADKINRDIADRVGVTIEHVQQHRSFLKLDDADQQRLALPKDDPRRLSVRDARQKVANKDANKPLDLSAAERLLFAELAHASRVANTYAYNAFPVGQEAQTDMILAGLITHKLVEGPPKLQEWGETAGHFTIRVGYYAYADRYFDWYSKGDAQDRLAGLRAEQAAAGVTPEATYATPWLNGPFEMTEEGKAIAEALAERDRNAAANRAEYEAQRAAEKARYAEAREKHLAALNAAAQASPADMAAATVEAASAIDNPLPWTLLDDGDVVDATGAEVERFSGYYGGASDDEMIFLQMVVVSVNSAAGLPTPPIKSADQHREEMEKAEEARLQTEADAANADEPPVETEAA